MRGKCVTSSMREDEGIYPVRVIERFCFDDEPLRKVHPNVGESAFSQMTERLKKPASDAASQSFHGH